MTLEEAIGLPGKKVQVTGETERNGELALMIVTLSADGAKQVAGQYVPIAEHAALVASFEARGAPVGHSDFHTQIVWLRHHDGLEVYDEATKLFDAAGERATLANGTIVERSDITRVFASASSNYVHRRVTAVSRRAELVTEVSLSAMGDPAYSRNELLFETSGWLPQLACDIAAWARVGFEDRIQGSS